jgi:NAD(P)-dependent dehydrogenase (short-subunit alcohol dehydrogenase family)
MRAVVTGGGSGMGRQLVVQLAAQGCCVATCDVNPAGLVDTQARAEADAPAGTKVTTHLCDVSEEAQVLAFRNDVVDAHGSVIELLLNNAGISGGYSFITDSREEWERTFAVDWWGVYYCTRAFLPHLLAADEAQLVNTSSVNGFWASLGPRWAMNTAYSTAKFAVKGFSEALIEDLRVNAPHVKVAVVMPGHVDTDIAANSRRYFDRPEPDALTEPDLWAKEQMARHGVPVEQLSTEQLRGLMNNVGESSAAHAALDAAEAATVILDAVRAGKWRILVGDDARQIDEHVRANPDTSYDYSTWRPPV